jgi:hypothetical protein
MHAPPVISVLALKTGFIKRCTLESSALNSQIIELPTVKEVSRKPRESTCGENTLYSHAQSIASHGIRCNAEGDGEKNQCVIDTV